MSEASPNQVPPVATITPDQPAAPPAAPYHAPPPTAQGLQPYTAPTPPPAAAPRPARPKRRRGFKARVAGAVLTVAGAIGLSAGAVGVAVAAHRIDAAPPVETGTVLTLEADTPYAVFGARDSLVADYEVEITGPDGEAVQVDGFPAALPLNSNRRPAVALFETDAAGEYTFVTVGDSAPASVASARLIGFLGGSAVAIVAGVLALLGGIPCLVVGNLIKRRRLPARPVAVAVARLEGRYRTADAEPVVQDPPRVGEGYRVYPGA
jgi:hypothetical protein